jgi:hypothetical protein
LYFEKDTIYFGTTEKWILTYRADSIYKLDASEFSTFLIRKEKEDSTVQQLYDLTKGEYTPELFLFEKEAEVRRKRLEQKMNGL